MAPWDHSSTNKLFSDLSGARHHVGHHLKQQHYTHTAGEKTQNGLLSVMCFSRSRHEGFETPRDFQKK